MNNIHRGDIYYTDGWCSLYDRYCGQIHIDMIKEDGEE